MKIGIVSQNKEINITGINRVTLGTLSELRRIDSQNEYYFVGKSEWLGIDMPYVPIVFASHKTLQLNYLLLEHGFDIIHSHYRPFHIAGKFPCGKLITIHDLIALKYPDFAPLDAYAYFDECIRKSAEEADCIIAVSECTKNDIVEYYHIPEEKISVIYNGLYPKDFISAGGGPSGCPQAFDGGRAGRAEEEISELKGQEYLLSVSGIGRNKNQKGIVKAFLEYKRKHGSSRAKLVITGPIRQYDTVRYILEKYGDAAEDVIFTGFVSDGLLARLYRQAAAFIYASFYEGFGLPILEAMSVGKAVISSNTSSMPEVGGDAVEYCDPCDVDSMAAAMEKVLEDRDYREQLEKKALVQAGKFSYEKAARQTLEIYKRFE